MLWWHFHAQNKGRRVTRAIQSILYASQIKSAASVPGIAEFHYLRAKVIGVFKSCALYSLLASRMARILIADDSEPMRIALKTLFALRPQWEICAEAENGREAVAKATELQPDMIVLDFKMPLSNGLQAAGEISRTMPTTPIVMYTFDGNADLEIVAKHAGIWRVVAKEHGVQELLSAMDSELAAKEYKRKAQHA